MRQRREEDVSQCRDSTVREAEQGKSVQSWKTAFSVTVGSRQNTCSARTRAHTHARADGHTVTSNQNETFVFELAV